MLSCRLDYPPKKSQKYSFFIVSQRKLLSYLKADDYHQSISKESVQ